MTDMEFEEKFRLISAAVKAKLDAASGCHDYDHTRRVLNNALLLAEELPGADSRVVRMAALLHDVARPEEMSEKGKVCHAVLGAELVIPLLRDAEFEPDFIRHVSSAVLTHRYRANRIPASLEAEIVYDADKLDSLGAVGIGRAFLFAGREHARLHNTEDEAVNSPAYSREDTAYREYLVKLRKLPAGMLTEPGKRIALERARFMTDFFKRLNEETGLNL
ncbi:MAG: HD domain-containing protein [Lentisphaeria bacterium]|nr:HD domain-containing protein [Lentisphaeria bacterium]